MEIEASGYTKEMQEDDELLYPAGPDGEGHKAELSPPVQDPEGENTCCSGTDQKKGGDITDEIEDASENKFSQDLVQTSEEEEESASESEHKLDLSAVSCALQEVEGQIIAAGDGTNAASSLIDFSGDREEIGKPAKTEEQTEHGEDPTNDNEDKCLDLADLATSNRGFRPFRYRFTSIVEGFSCICTLFSLPQRGAPVKC